MPFNCFLMGIYSDIGTIACYSLVFRLLFLPPIHDSCLEQMALVLEMSVFSVIKFTFIISHFNYNVSFLTPSLSSFPPINVDS